MNITRIITEKIFFTKWYKYWLAWHELWAIVHTLRNKAGLERLADWAKRKRFTGPRKYYEDLLFEIDRNLSWKSRRSPGVAELAMWIFTVVEMITPSSESYSKGAAARYRLGKA